MINLFATLIIYGRKTINDVPKTLREQVKQVLIESGCEHLMVE